LVFVSEPMKKKSVKKKVVTKSGAQLAGRFCQRVPPDHPIYGLGFAVGGRYPTRKASPSNSDQLDEIASELAMERNADPADEDIQREAVFKAVADRIRKSCS
jgi:hypothetical protein